MNIILALIALVGLSVVVAIMFLYKIISDKIKILFGYKLYEYTKILSYGMKEVKEWHKNDKEALEGNSYYDFVDVIKPYKERLK